MLLTPFLRLTTKGPRGPIQDLRGPIQGPRVRIQGPRVPMQGPKVPIQGPNLATQFHQAIMQVVTQVAFLSNISRRIITQVDLGAPHGCKHHLHPWTVHLGLNT